MTRHELLCWPGERCAPRKALSSQDSPPWGTRALSCGTWSLSPGGTRALSSRDTGSELRDTGSGLRDTGSEPREDTGSGLWDMGSEPGEDAGSEPREDTGGLALGGACGRRAASGPAEMRDQHRPMTVKGTRGVTSAVAGPWFLDLWGWRIGVARVFLSLWEHPSFARLGEAGHTWASVWGASRTSWGLPDPFSVMVPASA